MGKAVSPQATAEYLKPGGRYLFAASDFLEKNTPLDNIKAMLRAATEEGCY